MLFHRDSRVSSVIFQILGCPPSNKACPQLPPLWKNPGYATDWWIQRLQQEHEIWSTTITGTIVFWTSVSKTERGYPTPSGDKCAYLRRKPTGLHTGNWWLGLLDSCFILCHKCTSPHLLGWFLYMSIRHVLVRMWCGTLLSIRPFNCSVPCMLWRMLECPWKGAH